MASDIMATFAIFGTFLLSTCYAQSLTDPLKIDFPSATVHAVSTGNINMLSQNGDIMIEHNGTGRVTFDGEDLNYIIQLILSQPPVWEDHSPFGYLGEFKAGEKMSVTVKAKDPEGQPLVYSLVAGSLPPGIKLEAMSGRIHGVIPDSDATYTVTIRATDNYGHIADSVFKIVTRGIIYCDKSPCVNQGVCLDEDTGYKCYCADPYGGQRCGTDCRNNHLIGNTNAKVVPDASLTGYLMYSNNQASAARMNSGGWYGMNSSSYLQVDFGNISHIDNIQIKGRDSSSYRYYYTGTFYIQYSNDGNVFQNYTSKSTGNTHVFNGISYNSVHQENLPEPLYTKFIRLFPLSWNRSYKPYMNIEINGCYDN